jgi:hypothetical protein
MINGMRPRMIKGEESRRRRKKIIRKKEAPYSQVRRCNTHGGLKSFVCPGLGSCHHRGLAGVLPG